MNLIRALESDEAGLAADVVQRMELADPQLYAAYGPKARERTLEDVTFHLQHLRGALAVGDPEVFRAYKEWLNEVLLSRNIKGEHIRICFEAISDSLAAAYGQQAAEAIEYLEADPLIDGIS